MYLRLGSVNAVAKRINDLGWPKKLHRTKAGREIGGGRWRDKDVHLVLRNATYLGKVDFKGELYEGEHGQPRTADCGSRPQGGSGGSRSEPFVSEELFARVQSVLSSKACGRGSRRGRNPEYLLQGITWCGLYGKRITSTNLLVGGRGATAAPTPASARRSSSSWWSAG